MHNDGSDARHAVDHFTEFDLNRADEQKDKLELPQLETNRPPGRPGPIVFTAEPGKDLRRQAHAGRHAQRPAAGSRLQSPRPIRTAPNRRWHRRSVAAQVPRAERCRAPDQDPTLSISSIRR